MRVLVVAPHDPTGALYGLCRALRRHGCAETRLLTLREVEPRPLGPPADVCRLHDGGHELRELVRTAEVFHLVDLTPADVPFADLWSQRATPPRFVFHWSGASLEQGRTLAQMATRFGTPLISERPGVTSAAFLPPWISHGTPPWVPLLPGTRTRARSQTVMLFASAPEPLSHRPRLERLIETAERLCEASPVPGRTLRVEVVIDPLARSVAQRRRRAHLTLADADGAMPLEALEALAQGLPTIAALDPETRAAYEALGHGPVPILEPIALEACLPQLDPMADPDAASVAWLRRVAAPEPWLALCQQVYATACPIPRVA